MTKANSFFSAKNTVKTLTKGDTLQTSNYLEVIEAFSRATNQSIYVIDYEKKGFEYVSNNPLFLNGYSAEQVLTMGYEFYFENVPKSDLNLLLKINEVGFTFYEDIPLMNRKEYAISYDFHLINKEGKSILINQKLTPLFLTESGKIWKAICMVTLSTRQQAGNIMISRVGHNESYTYDLTKNRWRTVQKIILTDREKEILQFSIRGYSITEIAHKVFLSPDTIKFHRKKMFEKFEVSNIGEAILYATSNKLL